MEEKKQEVRLKVYWEDRQGAKNSIFTRGVDIEETVKSVFEYIREQLYMDSFSIVGLDKWEGNGWKKVGFDVIRCKGR